MDSEATTIAGYKVAVVPPERTIEERVTAIERRLAALEQSETKKE